MDHVDDSGGFWDLASQTSNVDITGLIGDSDGKVNC